MTEEEWLRCRKVEDMVRALVTEKLTFRTRWLGPVESPRFKVSEGQWARFYRACIMRIKNLLSVLSAREGSGTAARRRARQAAISRGQEIVNAMEQTLTIQSSDARNMAFVYLANLQWFFDYLEFKADVHLEEGGQADLLRDIIGNPFRPHPVIDPLWLRWNDSLVTRLAVRIKEDNRYDDLPILADALEDSGCANEEILTHCRGPGPHYPGCWVIELIPDIA